MAKRGGPDEVFRRVPAPVDEFSIDLELTVEIDGEPVSVEYGFTIGHAASDRDALVVKRERCFIRLHEDESELVFQEFEVEKGRTHDGARIEPDRLYLPLAATRADFSDVYHALRSMLFHHLDTDRMRQIEHDRRGTPLGYSGERLGPVLGTLAERHPVVKRRIDDYLRAIVPAVEGIDQQIVGDYSTVVLRTRDSERPFGPKLISGGTLHAAGLLAALFQPVVLEGQAPLLAIEEPENSLHPAAAGALFDALTEASERVQVLVTTRSADLLDRDEFDPDAVRVAAMTGAVTMIGTIDEVSRRLIEEKQTTLGELIRGGRLLPRASESPEKAEDDAESGVDLVELLR
jgi:predicted ATPase